MFNEKVRALVIGANGMLGQDLVPILIEEGYQVITPDLDELDITQPTQVTQFFQDNKPHIILHCAGYTNVDKAEEEPEESFLINETGTKNVALECKKLGATLVYISTDYVFNGEKSTPYEPNDLTDPLNVYGKSKLYGEYAALLNPQTYIVRSSWLYGINGNNFVKTMINIGRKQKEVKVVNDQIGCPTWTIPLSKAIITILKNNQPFNIYHICASDHTSWYNYACEIFNLMNMPVKVIPVTSEEFIRPAKRPKYSAMNNNNCCPHWKSSLREFIDKYREKL